MIAVLQLTDGQPSLPRFPGRAASPTTAVAVTVNGVAAVVNASAAATEICRERPISTIAILATDAAGNTSQQSLSLNAVSRPIAIRARPRTRI